MNQTSIPWFVFAICYSAGILLIGLATPLIRRRVKPNGTYGVRVPATLADEFVWYDINARGGWHLLGIGVVYLALVTIALVFGQGWTVEARILGPLGVLVTALVADAVVLWVSADRLLAQRRAGSKSAS